MAPVHTDNVPEKLRKGAASFENVWDEDDMSHISFRRGEAIGICRSSSRCLCIGRSELSQCFDQIRPAIAPYITIDSKGVRDYNTCVTETEQAVDWQLMSALAIWDAHKAIIV
jgi:hypothetical protein